MPAFFQRGGAWVLVQSVLLLAALFAPVWRCNEWEGEWSIWSGLALIVISALIGIWGVSVLGRNRTPFPMPNPGSQLVRSGIYRWVRHPLYVSVIAFCVGWALGWQSWPAVIVAGVTPFFFAAKARCEERWLRAQFPDYAEYARETWRFVPWIY